LKPQFFDRNIKLALKNRKEQYVEKRNQQIEISSDVYQIIMNSHNIPASKCT